MQGDSLMHANRIAIRVDTLCGASARIFGIDAISVKQTFCEYTHLLFQPTGSMNFGESMVSVVDTGAIGDFRSQY